MTSPLAFSSPPWMTTQGELRRSAYFSCLPRLLRIAEIELGADVRRRAGPRPFSDNLRCGPVEHGDDHRAGLGLFVELADMLSAAAAATRRWKIPSPAPARRGSATPARHSARRRRPSRSAPGRPFCLGFEQELYFENRAGVVFEAADDGRVDTMRPRITGSRTSLEIFCQFRQSSAGSNSSPSAKLSYSASSFDHDPLVAPVSRQLRVERSSMNSGRSAV